jgi:adenosine deaminase
MATQIWNLNEVDVTEVIVNGICQSMFPMTKKQKWLSQSYMTSAQPFTQDLSSIRQAYRMEMFVNERRFIEVNAGLEQPH